MGHYVTSYSCHVVHSWRLQPQNERCQLIKAHMSSGEITGEHFQSLEYLVQKVVLSLIWFQSSEAVWESRWPSWAPCPNAPYGFCGRKATLNYASTGIGHSLSLICQPASEDIKLYIIILIWLHSLVWQMHNKQMSQLVAYGGNICVELFHV